MLHACPPDLESAAWRLRGHLVATPVIGGLCLPGYEAPEDLRLKAELLQPGGSLWFRGAQHWLLRQLGRCKGLAVAGDEYRVLAFARAAQSQRVDAVALLPEPPGEPLREALDAAGCAVQVGVDGAPPSGRFAGFTRAPPPDEPEFVAGIATVVLELVQELPSDTQRVVVAPRALAPAVEAGVVRLGLPWQVTTAPDDRDGEAVARALRTHHRLCTTAAGGAALAAAIAAGRPATCVLLGV